MFARTGCLNTLKKLVDIVYLSPVNWYLSIMKSARVSIY